MPSRVRRPYAPRMPVDDRREQILDAALDIIARDGWAALTIEAIAREVGVTRPVVYGAFTDLGAILSALFVRQEERALSVIEEALPGLEDLGDPDEALVQALTRFVSAVGEDPRGWRVILLPADGTPAVVKNIVDANRQAYRDRMRELVKAG